MRLGWMRLRWPMSAGASATSRRTRLPPPRWPPTQARPSFSRFSSYSRATLICNIRFPGGDVLMKGSGVGVLGESLAQLAVAEHLRQLRKDLQMLLGGLFRNQQHENQSDRLAVGCVEGHCIGQAHEGAY